MKKYLWTFHVL